MPTIGLLSIRPRIASLIRPNNYPKIEFQFQRIARLSRLCILTMWHPEWSWYTHKNLHTLSVCPKTNEWILGLRYLRIFGRPRTTNFMRKTFKHENGGSPRQSVSYSFLRCWRSIWGRKPYYHHLKALRKRRERDQRLIVFRDKVYVH